MIKAIETIYKGYRFRSRLEARWAVFFNACGVRWEYEPEGFDLGDGIKYLPDFVLHGVDLRHKLDTDLYVEVKGEMTKGDAEKIRRFHDPEKLGGYAFEAPDRYNPILVVSSRIPEDADVLRYGEWEWDVEPYNFETVDGDYFGALPGVDKKGRFTLFGADSNYMHDLDYERTMTAYDKARQARFEHGETPQ